MHNYVVLISLHGEKTSNEIFQISISKLKIVLECIWTKHLHYLVKVVHPNLNFWYVLTILNQTNLPNLNVDELAPQVLGTVVLTATNLKCVSS